jgi:hypothetical protein
MTKSELNPASAIYDKLIVIKKDRLIKVDRINKIIIDLRNNTDGKSKFSFVKINLW